jgi:hypothetical protein
MSGKVIIKPNRRSYRQRFFVTPVVKFNDVYGHFFIVACSVIYSLKIVPWTKKSGSPIIDRPILIRQRFPTWGTWKISRYVCAKYFLSSILFFKNVDSYLVKADFFSGREQKKVRNRFKSRVALIKFFTFCRS